MPKKVARVAQLKTKPITVYKMAKLKTILQNNKFGKYYNFVQSRKNQAGIVGKYTLPESFLPYYIQAYPKFNDKSPCLVWRVHDRDKMYCYFDFDFKSKSYIDNNDRDWVKLIEAIAKKINCDKNVYATRRVSCYKNKHQYKHGFHIYIPDHMCTTINMRQYKTKILNLPEFKQFVISNNITTPPEKIVDQVAIDRSNGLYMIGSRKSGYTTNSPHYIFYANNKILNFGWEFKKENRTTFLKIMKEIYTPILKQDFTVQKKTITKPKMSGYMFLTPQHDAGVVKNDIEILTSQQCLVKNDAQTPFNLALFLESIDITRIDHGQWKRILYYCRILKMDKSIVCKTLNKYFKPKDKKENERVWDSYSGDKSVTKASIIYLLNQFSNKSYDLDTIFPMSRFKYHNESSIFLDNTVAWDEEEVIQFFDDVYSYTFGEGRTVFLYTELKYKRYGQRYILVENFVQSKNNPFEGSSDISVMLHPTLDDLLKVAIKFCTKKCSKDQIKIQQRLDIFLDKNPSRNELATELEILDLLPNPKSSTLSKMFVVAKRSGQLKKRYYGFDFIPYLRKEDSTCPPDIYNIFSGFEMQKFRNTKIDIKKTRIWKWLSKALCNNDPFKLQYLLTCIATKLQQPHRKLSKFIVIFSRLCGTGKSSIEKFLSKLLGEEYVMMVQSIEEFLSENNTFLLGKLFIVIDDIEKASKSLSDKLKSRISEPYFTLKKLYEDKKTCRSYCDLITTSNSKTPVFIASDNRRTELIEINDILEKEGVKFWKPFYEEELESTEIMGAFFEYFCTMKLDLDIRSKMVRFDNGMLQKQKLKSMKSVHRWLVHFFANEACFECLYNKNYTGVDYFLPLKFVEPNQVVMTIDRAYDYFKHWMKNGGSRLLPSKNTFTDDLQDIGIHKKRIKISKSSGLSLRKYCIALDSSVSGLLKAFYKIDDVQLSWCLDNKETFDTIYNGYNESVFNYVKGPNKYGFNA